MKNAGDEATGRAGPGNGTKPEETDRGRASTGWRWARARGIEWLGLLGWLALCFGASAFGAVFSPGDWYASLRKPSWNPPSWVFGPVWGVLYTMMAVAAWLVWRRGGWRMRGRPLGWFLVQLGLNAAWTPLFFGWHRMGVALAEMLLLWLAIGVTALAFARVSRIAAWMLVPYLGWVSFAAWLNFTLWRMNP